MPVHTSLTQLAHEIGGIIEGEELLYPSPDTPVFISTEDGSKFFLASQIPLYTIKNGKPRRARLETKGEDAGWYYAAVPAEQLRKALDLALEQSDSIGDELEFAYESILRDHCARNLTKIEAGLKLYHKDGVTGVEFPAGGRFIDILAVDSIGRLVVFEFKLSRGHERVVGQLLRYMGWIQQHVAIPKQQVRGVIVARQITDDLRLAAASQPAVRLMEYALSVTLKDA